MRMMHERRVRIVYAYGWMVGNVMNELVQVKGRIAHRVFHYGQQLPFMEYAIRNTRYSYTPVVCL